MASAAPAQAHGEFVIGRVLARATDMARRRFGAMLVVALLLAALPVPIRLLGSEAFVQALRGGGRGQLFTYLLSMLAGSVFSAVCLGALIRLAIGEDEGRRIDAADALYLALRSAPRLIGLYLMMQIATWVAMLLLVVPGIILAVALTVAIPAAVIEGRGGTRAFDRSFDLTKGARWQIFALWLIFWVALGAIGYLIRAAFGGTPAITLAAPPVAFLLVEGVVATVSTIAVATLESSVYVELRTWKEGAPREELSEIFA